MEHFDMVIMFKTLENTGLKGFLNATSSVFEAAVGEFFANAKVIAGTIPEGQEMRVLEKKKAVSKKKQTETTEVNKKKKKLVKKMVTSQIVEAELCKETSNKENQEGVIHVDDQPESQTNDAFIDDGPDGHEGTVPEQEEHVVGDDRQEPTLGCDTQMDEEGPDENVSNVAAQGEQGKPTAHGLAHHEGETTEIEDWVDNDEQIERDESSAQIEKETATNDRAIVSRSGSMANFKLDVPTVNYDYLCIRFLIKELKEIARQHRDKRVLAGLSIVAPEASFVGVASAQSEQPPPFAIEFSTQDEHEQTKAKESAQQEKQVDGNVEVVNWIVEQIEETGNKKLDSAGRHHMAEQQAPEKRDEPHRSPSTSGSNSTGRFSHTGPSLTLSSTLHLEPNPSNLQMVVFISSPPASPITGSKLEEVEKVIASLDSRIMSMDSRMLSMDSRMLSMDSKVQSMHSKLGSIDSKMEQLLNVQTFMKHDFGAYKCAFYDKMDTVAGNVKSSQTSLETIVLHHLTEHQLQLASDLGLVKLQLAELVDHLKQTRGRSEQYKRGVVIDRRTGVPCQSSTDQSALSTESKTMACGNGKRVIGSCSTWNQFKLDQIEKRNSRSKSSRRRHMRRRPPCRARAMARATPSRAGRAMGTLTTRAGRAAGAWWPDERAAAGRWSAQVYAAGRRLSSALARSDARAGRTRGGA
ncbi:hypothetical protein F511_29377 [Dorcoceras hygrometricum]|uniref:Uncharacterized protein n=1 Tax=Dorcoceras hygrometricum TaxID=472368 RepID=A0A2Z7DH16_9LAMI|nr:hypothetical protein F511_29377 [Dorcoceras hygrometricum]